MISRRTDDASLSSRYHYILHYCSECELRLDAGITFTFAGFLLFSVMPRVIAASRKLNRRRLWIRRMYWKCASLLRLSENERLRRFCISVMETGTRGDSYFSSTMRISRIYSLIYNIRHATLRRGTSFILQYCYLDLRRPCWCKSINRNVKHSARPVPQYCTENGCELNTFSDISLMYVI